MISIDELAVFCKKKGFVYPSSEIYGGFAGFFDYGPLGVELKNNIVKELWHEFVQKRPDIVGIDGSILTHPKVWEASGHVESFKDKLAICKKCKSSFKAEVKKCPRCGSGLEEKGQYNLMFKTNNSYLRPETAQLMFTNFKLINETSRTKLPFGIAQHGKAFRNEISPRDFLFRVKEFEMFEIEYFVDPKKLDECPFLNEIKNLRINILTANMQKKKQKHKGATIKELIDKKIIKVWHAYWIARFYKWFLQLGIKKENLRLREHLKEELSHYATACFDIEYNFPFGWKELHGNADRTDYDLKQHMKFSKTDLTIFDQETNQKIIPYVAAEPSQGIGRAFLAFMLDAYNDDKKRGNIVLKLHPKLAPYKIAVFPLVSNKKEVVKKAIEVFNLLKEDFNCFYDSAGSIGRRYARQDEIGTPFCITIDFDSLKKNDVTIRDINTTKQIRVKIKDLKEKLKEA